MKNTVFKGIATALITPFTPDGAKIDYDSFGRLIDWQIESGIDALVIAGTTGEASTLTDDEHRTLIDFAVKRTNKRVPIIAGAGSNDTGYALDLVRCASESGADAMLVVTPYYNKATQKGLIQMYTQIADFSDKPIILYNVPSRTGVNIEPTTYRELAAHPNICGIKEANGNIGKIVETMQYVCDDLDLYSGNDDQIVPLMSLGGVGAISVLSNVLPAETRQITELFFKGDISGAAHMQYKMHSLIDALFCEVNPIPVKAAMAALGYCSNSLRLPLTPMEEAHQAAMLSIMKTHGLLQDK